MIKLILYSLLTFQQWFINLLNKTKKKQILDCLVNGKNMVTEFYYIFFIEIYYMYCYKSGNSPTMFGSCLVVSHSLPIKMVIMVKWKKWVGYQVTRKPIFTMILGIYLIVFFPTKNSIIIQQSTLFWYDPMVIAMILGQVNT